MQAMTGDALPPALETRRAAVFAASAFVAGAAARDPALLPGLAASGELERARSPGEIGTLAAAIAAGDEAGFMDALRRLRRRELVRIAWRDLAGTAPFPETLAETSALADAAIAAARTFAERALAPRYGTPRSAAGEAQELLVIGMGKLGGGELNFSSDIDLVFLFPESGETDGPRAVSNEEYFTRLGQSLIRLLDARTAEGFVYRVDMRLRPLGEPGPLAMNFAGFEGYLQQHGRDWERYAWVKARAVTGADRYRALFADVVRPFVYRRYLDFGVYESLREMKAMIAREVERRELQDNVKLGPGGIREIEFIVQSQQLIRGGSEPGLQTPSLLSALPRLAGAKLLAPATVAELADSYAFLRRVENRLQMANDAQEHDLPADEAGRERLAAAMGNGDWASFAGALEAHRRRVTAHFDAVVLGRGGGGERVTGGGLESLWMDEPALERVVEDVARFGLADAPSAARLLFELRQSAYFRRLDAFGRRRLAILVPRILGAVARAEADGGGDGQPLLARLLGIVEAIAGRTAYLALLNENAQALERLVEACRMGDYLARQVAAHPLLLDELLDARVFETLPDRDQFALELAARLGHAGDDEEQRIDALRHFRRAATFRIALQDLTGRLPLMQVSDRLTDVAELILEQALAIAWRHTTAQYGEPRCVEEGQARTPRVGIAGYGKLGGMELGYASDLDLVFLHDSAGGGQQTTGPKVVDNEVFFLRLAQRLLHVLTVHTPAGRLYEVDVRRALPARAASRSPRSARSRRTSGARPGPSSTRRCCIRAGWRATRRSARPTPGSAARCSSRRSGARRCARTSWRCASACARSTASRATGSSTSSTTAAGSRTSSSSPSTGCCGTCASTRRSPRSRTPSATSSPWAPRRSWTTGSSTGSWTPTAPIAAPRTTWHWTGAPRSWTPPSSRRCAPGSPRSGTG
jgi:glutamate-ammonia-ligase adenylyltransferase